MKNRELNVLSVAIEQLAELKMQGALKFKIVKVFKQIDSEMEVLRQAVQGLNPTSAEYQEILEADNKIEFNTKFTFNELEHLELSAFQLLLLEPLIEEVPDVKDSE